MSTVGPKGLTRETTDLVWDHQACPGSVAACRISVHPPRGFPEVPVCQITFVPADHSQRSNDRRWAEVMAASGRIPVAADSEIVRLPDGR